MRRGSIRQRGRTFTAIWDQHLIGLPRVQRSQGGFKTRVEAEMFLARRLDRLPDEVLPPDAPPRNRLVVYFIQEGNDGPVKIGYTFNGRTVPIRLSACQVGNHRRLTLRATTPGGRQLERALHDRFAAHRLGGEWFEPTPGLLALIDSLAHSVYTGLTDEDADRAVEPSAAPQG